MHGEVYTWGEGAEGALGHGENATTFFPRKVSTLRKKFITTVACSQGYTLFVSCEYTNCSFISLLTPALKLVVPSMYAVQIGIIGSDLIVKIP